MSDTAQDIELGQRLWVYAVDVGGTDDETAEDLGRRARELVGEEIAQLRAERDEALSELELVCQACGTTAEEVMLSDDPEVSHPHQVVAVSLQYERDTGADAVEHERAQRIEALRHAIAGWNSARTLAIACDAHATERAADDALGRLDVALAAALLADDGGAL